MDLIIRALVTACCATCVLEILPVFCIGKSLRWVKASLVCNIVTNPALNTLLLLLAQFITNSSVILCIIIVLEVLIIIVEAYFYKMMLQELFVKCLLISFLANLISFLVGFGLPDSIYTQI